MLFFRKGEMLLVCLFSLACVIRGLQLPTLVFQHIPKTAGVSFYRDFHRKTFHFVLESPGFDERCFYRIRKVPGDFRATFLRHPVKHVMSQYTMCRYSKWGRQTTKDEWETKLVKDPYGGFDDWVFAYASGYRETNGCYFPRNLQVRFLTCSIKQGHEYIAGLDNNYTLALENLLTYHSFGLTEYYRESACLIHYETKGEILDLCHCNSSWIPTHMDHNVQHLQVSKIRKETLDMIYRMNMHDILLFREATNIFLTKIHNLESSTGIKIICE